MSFFSLSFSPFVSWPILFAAGAFGLALALAVIWRYGASGSTRALALGLFLLALTNPSLMREEREPLKDIVGVVIDRSASQDLGDRRIQTDLARDSLMKTLKGFDNLETRVMETGGDDPDRTLLFGALQKLLSDAPPERVGGVIFITDGQIHDIPKDLAPFGLTAPLHGLIVGHEKERDRRIALVEAPRYGIVNKEARFQLRAEDFGGDGAPFAIHVRRDGETIAHINAKPGETFNFPVKIEHGGPNVFEFEAQGVKGELTERNNHVVVVVDGVRDKLKVLLVSGEPNAGERTWRNLLRSDANVDLIHFTILRHPQSFDPTPVSELALIAFPTEELFRKKIREFDLVIFDRYSNHRLLQNAYLENIVAYVREGGALLLATGPDFADPDGVFYTPLGEIAPGAPTGQVIEKPFKPSRSQEGARHPVTRALQGVAPDRWSDWFRLVEAEKRRGIEVMTGADSKPLLILSREGKGRVAELLSDQIWLWARGYEGGGPYHELLRPLAHWLMKEPDLEEEALRAKAFGRTLRIERQTLTPGEAMVEIIAPSGAHNEIRLTGEKNGLAQGEFFAGETGLYRLKSGNLSALAIVGEDNPKEFQEVLSSQLPLRDLARASAGSVRRIESTGSTIAMPRIVWMREADTYSGDEWIGLKRTMASKARAVSVTPLGVGFGASFLFMLVLAFVWFLEGRGGRKN